MLNARLHAVREKKPLEVTEKDLHIEDVRVNYRSVDRAFLSNKNLPIDPNIVKNKEQEYEEEITRWADLDSFEYGD